MRVLACLFVLASTGCAGAAPAIVGPLDRADVERRLPEWRAARQSARPDPAAVRALAAVPPGAEVLVFLGTWCSDSLREVTRLWSALDALGAPPPFTVRWIGVDHAKRAPAGLLAGMRVRRVPTIVVRRAGREVGRIVETAPRGVERELLDLLAAGASTAPATAATPPSAAPPASAPPSAAAQQTVDLLRRTIASVAVSSTVQNPRLPPSDLVDGDLGTAWNSSTGNLEGAWIAFRVPAVAEVQSIRMTAGFVRENRQGDLFTMNPRIRKVKISRAGRVIGEYPLDPENRGLQEIPVRGPGGDWRVEIVDVLPGSRARWREVCVSELQVLGRAGGAVLRTPRNPDVLVGSLDVLRQEPDTPSGIPGTGLLPGPGTASLDDAAVAALIQRDNGWHADVDLAATARAHQRAGDTVVLALLWFHPRAEWEAEQTARGTLERARARIAREIARCEERRERAAAADDETFDWEVDCTDQAQPTIFHHGTYAACEELHLARVSVPRGGRPVVDWSQVLQSPACTDSIDMVSQAAPSIELRDVDRDGVLEAVLRYALATPQECAIGNSASLVEQIVDMHSGRTQLELTLRHVSQGAFEQQSISSLQWTDADADGHPDASMRRVAYIACDLDADGWPTGRAVQRSSEEELVWSEGSSCQVFRRVETLRYDPARDTWAGE